MSQVLREPLTPDAECDLHQRLLAGDPTATADLAVAFLDRLIDELRKWNPAVDEHVCVEAAGDAIIALDKNPNSYRSAGGTSLHAYLRMSAQGDLKNILARERRHTGKTTSLGDVELSPDAGKYFGCGGDPADRLSLQEELELAEPLLADVRDGLSTEEAEGVDLVLQGERTTDAFARVLRIEHLPFDEQQTAVKRFKDKISNRIKRARSAHAKPS